eukprot:14861553-Ditylum_brightwellii.AAC.1
MMFPCACAFNRVCGYQCNLTPHARTNCDNDTLQMCRGDDDDDYNDGKREALMDTNITSHLMPALLVLKIFFEFAEMKVMMITMMTKERQDDRYQCHLTPHGSTVGAKDTLQICDDDDENGKREEGNPFCSA